MLIFNTTNLLILTTCLFFSALLACNTEPETSNTIKQSDTSSTEIKIVEPESITQVKQDRLHETNYLMVAANMLERAINNQDINEHISILQSAEPEKLQNTLNTDDLRKCFWINTYNAFVQYYLKADSSLYTKDSARFLSKDSIIIAGNYLSLNDIENGVLSKNLNRADANDTARNVRLKKDFVGKFMVDNVDYRVHFALNNGAASCPPICIYLPSRTEEQLSLISKYYLQKVCEVKMEGTKHIVLVPAIIKLYAKDFGSKEDQKEMLRKYNVIGTDDNPAIAYKEFDRNLKVQNYKQF